MITKDKTKRQCAECGKDFTQEGKNGHQKTCSPECREVRRQNYRPSTKNSLLGREVQANRTKYQNRSKDKKERRYWLVLPANENDTTYKVYFHRMPDDVYTPKYYPTCEKCGNKYVKKCYQCLGAVVMDRPRWLSYKSH